MTDLNAIASQWDVIVVGGGPAGSAAAISAAKTGLRVLQVDAKTFPRRKVCGGCLNQVSAGLLRSLVGSDSPIWNDAVRLNRFRLMDRHRQFDFVTPTGVAIERSKLDAHLVEVGQRHGVTFLSPATATLGKLVSDSRIVELQHGSAMKELKSRVVVLATGLGQQRGEAKTFQQIPSATSRVGVEALIVSMTNKIDDGTIYMSIGRDGYVGLTKVSDTETHVAAAVDRISLRELGPQAIVQRILDESGVSQELNDQIVWRGTPALTAQAQRLASPRVFLVGDAANYVEPFTGEGILWALKSGVGVASFLTRAVADWDDSLIEQWEAWHQSNIQNGQRLCRQISFGLKHASLRWLAHQVIRFQPGFARSVIHRLNN